MITHYQERLGDQSRGTHSKEHSKGGSFKHRRSMKEVKKKKKRSRHEEEQKNTSRAICT